MGIEFDFYRRKYCFTYCGDRCDCGIREEEEESRNRRQRKPEDKNSEDKWKNT